MKTLFENWTCRAKIDFDKLIVAGHSMGAATAMMAGEGQESESQIWLFQVILATLALGQLRQAAKN